MRVVSLVPSWTETLIEAGVNVVGRTRYCIHPAAAVKDLPAVGGTKDLNLRKLQALQADLVVFDREENTQKMFAMVDGPKWVSHVTDLQSLNLELNRLGEQLANKPLRQWADALKTLPKPPSLKDMVNELPGVIQWVQRPPRGWSPERVHYLIWKDPLMEVSADTFIGSVLGHFGMAQRLPVAENRYPVTSWNKLQEPGGLILLSSEPFPFAHHLPLFKNFPNPVALVDGESFSWFGIRCLKFLSIP